jgi:hypothetical protein
LPATPTEKPWYASTKVAPVNVPRNSVDRFVGAIVAV